MDFDGPPEDFRPSAPTPAPAPAPSPASPQPPRSSLVPPFLSGFASGPKSFFTSRLGLATPPSQEASTTVSEAATVARAVGPKAVKDLASATFDALSDEEQHKVKSAASERTGEVVGAAATGFGFSRVAAAVLPHPALKLGFTAFSMAATAKVAKDAPAKAFDSFAEEHPVPAVAASTAVRKFSALPPTKQKEAVSATTQMLEDVAQQRRTSASAPHPPVETPKRPDEPT